jgi:hypothetical protein
MSNEIHVSDYQLRHSQRSEKSVPLSLEDLKLLPSKLEIASWFYDSSHNNLIATFDILSEMENDIGKVAIKINFAKKKKLTNNSIVTSGVIEASTLKMKIYREMKDEP